MQFGVRLVAGTVVVGSTWTAHFHRRRFWSRGGSGFLGGWCVVELLRRGYGCGRPCAISPASRRCGPRSGRRSIPAIGSRSLAADLHRDDGWARGGRRLRLRPPRRLAVPAGAAEGPRRADRAGAGRDAAGAARRPRGRRRAGRRHLLGRRGRAAAPSARRRPLTEADWTDPDDPSPDALRALEDDRRAGGLGPGPRSGARTERLAVVNPGAILGPVLERGPLLLAGGGRAAAEGDARHAADRLQLRRRPRRRRPADQGDDRPRGRRRALHRGRPLPVDGRRRRGPARAARAEQAPKVPKRDGPRTSWCGRWRSSTPASARSSASSASSSSSRARRREARSAGRRARSRRRSSTAPQSLIGEKVG